MKVWSITMVLGIIGGALGFGIGWSWEMAEEPRGKDARTRVGDRVLPARNQGASPERTKRLVKDRQAWMKGWDEVMSNRDRDQYDVLVQSVESWSPEELSQALREVWSMKDLMIKKEASRVLVRALAKSDPKAAHALLQELDPKRDARDFYLLLYREWARMNAPEAFAVYWEGSLARGQFSEEMAESIWTEWYRQDEATAFAEVRRWQKDEGLLHAALDALGARAHEAEERERAFAFIESFQDPRIQIRGTSSLVGAWAHGGDLEGAVAWADAREFSNDAERSLVDRVLGASMIAQDPEEGVAWLMARATEESESDYLRIAVEQWARRAPNGCAAWLEARGLGPETDEAVSVFTQEIMRDEPASAYAWAQEIRAPEERERRMAEVLRYWRRVDPSGAAEVAQD